MLGPWLLFRPGNKPTGSPFAGRRFIGARSGFWPELSWSGVVIYLVEPKWRKAGGRGGTRRRGG